MKKRSIWSGAALAAVMSLFMAAPVSAKEMTIPDGVFVGDIELGGMTKEEAGQTIQDHVNTLADRKVTLDIEGTPVEATAGELGFTWSNPEAVSYTHLDVYKRQPIYKVGIIRYNKTYLKGRR